MLLPVCECQDEKYYRGPKHIYKGVENGRRGLNRDFVERCTDAGTYKAAHPKKTRATLLPKQASDRYTTARLVRQGGLRRAKPVEERDGEKPSNTNTLCKR